MKLYETKKNMNETQSKDNYTVNNAERHNYESINSKKSFLLERSDYGWDGDY